MNSSNPEDWICRAHCSFYKPVRVEEERCRGYTLAHLLREGGVELSLPSPPITFDPSFEHSFLRHHVCDVCPFLIDGCDFTSPDPPDNCLPCGGLVVLSHLLKKGSLEHAHIKGADLMERAPGAYLSLTPRCAIKRLEEDYLYHVNTDELYEINEEAIDMLAQCDGSQSLHTLQPDPAFLDFCIEEDLLNVSDAPENREIRSGRSPIPSLRYLEWLVTHRCNLSCSHCYLGDPRQEDFPVELIRPLLDHFCEMQGLKIMVSGGEPTLYRHFDELNRALPEYPIRAVLLTNGITMDSALAAKLNFHEVQVSLDGMEHGHDSIRGSGSFQRAVSAMKAVREAGLDLSVATMVHRGNLQEWEAMRDLIHSMGAREWGVDYPCVKGRWETHPELAVEPAEAATKMAFAFGGSYHGASPGWTCGRHLAAVLPSGEVCRCGLYPDRCYGSIRDGLARAWTAVHHIPISDTDCSDCAVADSCGGGCRFRAPTMEAPDEVMCRFHNVRN